MTLDVIHNFETYLIDLARLGKSDDFAMYEMHSNTLLYLGRQPLVINEPAKTDNTNYFTTEKQKKVDDICELILAGKTTTEAMNHFGIYSFSHGFYVTLSDSQKKQIRNAKQLKTKNK